MRKRVTKTFGILKTTAIGGIIFLLPLAVIGWLLGYVFSIVQGAYQLLTENVTREQVEDFIPISDATFVVFLFLLTIGVVLAICFACGLAARRALGRKFSQTIEKQLIMVFPKYAIYKDIVAGNIGGNELAPTLTPVTVQLHDVTRIGYEAGRTQRGLVIAYLPGSPDPWIGSVVLVEPDRVQPLDVDFSETAAICERLGRQSAELLAAVSTRRARSEGVKTGDDSGQP